MTPELPTPNPEWWQGIGQWAAGITTVAVAIYVAVQRGVKQAKEVVTAPPIEHTRIITADSVAMQQLAASMEANTMAMTENNKLHREVLGEIRNYLADLREDRKEADIIAKVKQDLRSDAVEQERAHPTRRKPGLDP